MIFLYNMLYFSYFFTFLFVFLFNYTYYKLFSSFNYTLTYLLFKIINVNGAPMIKFTQWFLNVFDSVFECNKNKHNFVFDIFNNIYNNCSQHSLKYTKLIFSKDYFADFDDILTIDQSFFVKSGSIAQVYKCYHKQLNKYVAVKVVHPNIHYQFCWFKKIIDMYIYVTDFYIFKRYKLPFDFITMYDDFFKQTDLNNEYCNMKQFKEFYKNNKIVVIPNAFFSSKNILIMEFFDGTFFSELQCSEYFKTNIYSVFKLFNLDMIISKPILHNDLHIANWMIITDLSNNNVDMSYVPFDNIKIVVLDFGYCNNNFYIDFTKQFIFYSDNDEYDKLLDLVISTVSSENNSAINKNHILEYMIMCHNNHSKNLFNNKYINLDNHKNNLIDICINDCHDSEKLLQHLNNVNFFDKINFLVYFLKYCITYNIVLNKYLFDLLIQFVISWKNLSLYTYNIDKKKAFSLQAYYCKKYDFQEIHNWNKLYYNQNKDLYNIYSNNYLHDISCNNLNDIISI